MRYYGGGIAGQNGFHYVCWLILSAGTEYAQYRYALGMAEVDDVICNTLGAFMARSSVPPRCS